MFRRRKNINQTKRLFVNWCASNVNFFKQLWISSGALCCRQLLHNTDTRAVLTARHKIEHFFHGPNIQFNKNLLNVWDWINEKFIDDFITIHSLNKRAVLSFIWSNLVQSVRFGFFHFLGLKWNIHELLNFWQRERERKSEFNSKLKWKSNSILKWHTIFNGTKWKCIFLLSQMKTRKIKSSQQNIYI